MEVVSEDKAERQYLYWKTSDGSTITIDGLKGESEGPVVAKKGVMPWSKGAYYNYVLTVKGSEPIE